MPRPKIAWSYLLYWISIGGRSGTFSPYIYNLICHNHRQYKLSMQLRKNTSTKTMQSCKKKVRKYFIYIITAFYFSQFYRCIFNIFELYIYIFILPSYKRKMYIFENRVCAEKYNYVIF